MASDGEGTVYIPQQAFFDLVKSYAAVSFDDSMVVIGAPYWDCNGDLVVAFAWSTECPPEEWTGDAPKAVRQAMMTSKIADLIEQKGASDA